MERINSNVKCIKTLKDNLIDDKANLFTEKVFREVTFHTVLYW